MVGAKPIHSCRRLSGTEILLFQCGLIYSLINFILFSQDNTQINSAGHNTNTKQ
jgi:hypothetical protein